MDRISAFERCIKANDLELAMYAITNLNGEPDKDEISQLVELCPKRWVVEFGKKMKKHLTDKEISSLVKKVISADAIFFIREIAGNPRITQENVDEFYVKCPTGRHQELRSIFTMFEEKDHV